MKSALSESRSCTIEFEDGFKVPFSYIWLRDHCTCNACFHPVTQQRQLNTLQIPEDIAPTSLNIVNSGDALKITWHGNTPQEHTSIFDVAWLRKKGDPVVLQLSERHTWGRELQQDIDSVVVSYHDIKSNTGAFLRYLSIIERYGFALLKDVPANPEETRKICEMIGPLKDSIYGKFWDIVFKEDTTSDMIDTAYASEALHQHTDGSYFYEPAGLQFFHILEKAREGGDTVLVDAFKVAEYLKQNCREAYDFFTTKAIPFQHINKSEYFVQKRKVFELDEEGKLVRFSYNNEDRAPFYLPPEEYGVFHRSLQQLLKAFEDPQHRIKLSLTPDMLLVTDNWRVTHGRTRFRGRRRLAGAYINHEDFVNRLRQLQGILL